MPKTRIQQVIIAYIPVLHRGYIQFFEAFPMAASLYLIDKTLIKQIDYLRKDLRSLSVGEATKLIGGLSRFDSIKALSAGDISKLDKPGVEMVMPDDDASHLLAQKLKKATVQYYPVFLRWDRRSIDNIDEPDSIKAIKPGQFEAKVMKEAMAAAQQSSDIWRRVGAVLILEKREAKKAANQGEPTPYSPWMEGDPRNVFNRGVAIEMSVFMHAEANLIAEAARRGTSLLGSSLYVTTFPCPACAKLIAHSGIQKLYYKDGYAVLDGKRVMEQYGVKLTKILMPDNNAENPAVWVPYKK